MNERGVVILDSLLVLAILLVIALTMIPAVAFLNTEVRHAQQLLHASEVAYIGVSKVRYESITVGTQEIDGVPYHWQYDVDRICVNFESVKGEEHYCIHTDESVE